MSQSYHEAVPFDFDTVVANLITEDDEPVDNPFSEKQQRLLTEQLYASWKPFDDETGESRKFFAAANVGVFTSVFNPPIVPDMFLSLDVEFQKDWVMKEHRAYFVWEFGKVPDVCIEIVSNSKGGEISKKKNRYAEMGVEFYIVFDPFLALSKEKLRVFQLGFSKRYVQYKSLEFPTMDLSLKIWDGEFEKLSNEWLRWCDLDGNLILTGEERANIEEERANVESERAESEKQRAESEKQRAESEKQRAESEKRRAESEKQRADNAEMELTKLRAELEMLKGN
ncbi:MAG: Uma2 family endonuclease [Pyrinomonadaceae bacterium]|nr:Uma2 family endonuclease [Pyrinomonadaceae bacterium]